METLKQGSEYCQNPRWMRDAVSRFLESPVYSVPLLDFIDENCGMFEDLDDNKLEYTIVHENFKELVDGLISDFLTSLGIPVPTFVHMLTNEVHASLYSIVVTSILTVDDFLLFKEMMLKRNFQISNQTLNQTHDLEEPADLHSVIDHLSDLSKQQQSDRAAAQPLSLADAFQQQAKVNDANLASARHADPAAILSRAHKDHADCAEEHCEQGNEEAQCLQHLHEPPTPPEPTWDGNSQPCKVETTMKEHDSRASKPPTTTTTMAEPNQKENNPWTANVSFESSQDVVLRREPETEILVDGDDDGLGDRTFRGTRPFVDSAESRKEHEKEEVHDPAEPTASKMLDNLLADMKVWKPKSLHLNVNDGQIQQRRRYLEQQRDRLLAHKKSAREKQMRFFRQLESKVDASPQKVKRPIRPMPTLSQDAEANKKREALRKELARCLKGELTNKTSNMAPNSKGLLISSGKKQRLISKTLIVHAPHHKRKQLKMQMLCERVRKLEERVWKEENQRGKHLPGYGGFIPQEDDSPVNDVQLPRHHVPDMEEWGGKTLGYTGHKPLNPCHENPNYMWNLDHSRNHHYTTSYGQTNQFTIQTTARMKKRPPIVRPLWPHEDPTAKRGVKGFFYEDPRLESSEEGKKQAKKYFAIVRPLEGTLMAMNSNRSIKSRVMQ